MNSWLLYIILGLSVSTLGFSYLSYKFYGDKVEAEYSLVQVIDANTALQKSLNLKDLSCKIDDASVVEVYVQKEELKAKIDAVSDNIEKLRKPVVVKQEIIKNESLKETNVLPDDGLLSPNIVSLLRQGYCSVYPADSECISQ